ncbi:MAG: hypothetical protein JW861_09950 [Bacteroidales bacterium]|nr:hypothetical protein [Bacteroidales bacterium]
MKMIAQPHPLLVAFLLSTCLDMLSFQSVSRSSVAVDGWQYMIIAPDAFWPVAQELRDFRQDQGISTQVFYISETGNTFEAIEAFIDNAYISWTVPPEAVLLLGDIGLIPSREHAAGYISDNFYSDVDQDGLPDLVIARIPAANLTEAQKASDKIAGYESDPSLSPDYYDHPVTSMCWVDNSEIMICSEVICGFFETVMGKSPVRENVIASGTPGSSWFAPDWVDYFGPGGLGYIPATPVYLTDWGANATRINNDINSGAFLVLNRDMGIPLGWQHPHYQVPDIAGLTNADPIFIISMNSSTGDFSYASGCFAYAMLAMDHGAAGVIASTGINYSDFYSEFAWYLFDALWEDFMPGSSIWVWPAPDGFRRPARALAALKHFMLVLSSLNPQVRENLTYSYHYFGEPYSFIHDQVPTAITAAHPLSLPPGATTLTMTAEMGSMIGLTVDHEIIGTAVATGSPLVIPIIPPVEGDEIKVTVTMQNRLRYTGTVQCVITDLKKPAALSPMEVSLHYDSRSRSLFIDGCGFTPHITVTVTDISGRRVMTDGMQIPARIETSFLPSGIYIVGITSGSYHSASKVIFN